MDQSEKAVQSCDPVERPSTSSATVPHAAPSSSKIAEKFSKKVW